MRLSQQTTPISAPSLHKITNGDDHPLTNTSVRQRLFNSNNMSNKDGADTSKSSSSLSSTNSATNPVAVESKPSLKDQFTRLESKSKYLLHIVLEKIAKLKQHSNKTPSQPSASNRFNSLSNDHSSKTEQFYPEEEEILVREHLVELREIITRMKSLSNDMNTLQGSKTLSPRVVDQIKTWELSVDGLHSGLRKAQLDFQQHIAKKSREDLMSLSRSPFDEVQPGRNRRGQVPQTISSNTTDTMLKTRQVLQETVQRSTGTLEQLAQSSLTIVNSQEDLKEQNTVVANSRKLLSKYGRREWTDRLLICLGLVFFFAVVGYIAQKRIF